MPFTQAEIQRIIDVKKFADTDLITQSIYCGDRDNFSDAKSYLANDEIVSALRNYQNYVGVTALHAAYQVGNQEIINLLIAKGWDENLKDDQDRSSSEYSYNNGYSMLHDFAEIPAHIPIGITK